MGPDIRIVVLGGEGMLGHKMFQMLRDGFAGTLCTIRGALAEPFYQRVDLFRQGGVLERVDAMDLPSLGSTLRGIHPEFIVNCVGVVKQRDEAKDAIACITLNSLLPHKLAEFARDWGGRVVHVSTDCVFSGRRGHYTEGDPSDAEDLYGKSKYLGEVAVENAITLRTSIIGRELSQFRSLLEWFLAQEGKTVRGFRRVTYTGVTTLQLAETVGRLVQQQPTLSGLYQVASDPISKHDLLGLAKVAFGVKLDIIPDDSEVSDRSLVGDKFVRATGLRCPSWIEMLGRLANDNTPYARWR